MRALVVDDSRAMRTILKKILMEIGFDVAEAGHGLEGLERLKEVPDVDVALVDWNMPEMDGLEFVKAVRGNHDYADMKVMMVSAENDMTKIARALMVGADEYAMKPVTKDIILEKLDVMGVKVPA
jgi:two-component system, chemotaxis family, chemotaxis protein CheY